jgi:hypothetical protein
MKDGKWITETGSEFSISDKKTQGLKPVMQKM